MSVIIYGVRPYGTVDAHGGEYAETRFFHLWFVPLIPTGSQWITSRTLDGSTGYQIDMHAKSVLAGYLRVWGPILALGMFGGAMAGHMSLLLVSAVAIALTALSWTWRNVRGEAKHRRSDFNYVALGTRCEPHRMGNELLGTFKQVVDDKWNELKPDRAPNDIARHGTKNPMEAVVAYGLLRIAAATRGRAGREEDADADRILDGAQTQLAIGEGPYREGVQGASVNGSLAAIVRAMAFTQQLLVDSSPQARAERQRRDKWRSRKQLIGLLLATPFAIGGVKMFVDAVRGAKEVTISDLRSMDPPTGRIVRVACDSIEPIWEETDSRGEATHKIAMCELGKYLLPVRLDADSPVPQREIQGELRHVHDRLIWVRDGLSRDPVMEARALEVFVDTSDPNEKIFLGIFGLTFALGAPVLWVLWFRARRRRKAEAAK